MNWMDWTAAELPPAMAAGDNLTEAKRRLEEYGYVIITGVLSPAEVVAVRTRLETQAAAERARGLATLTTPLTSEQNKKHLAGGAWNEQSNLNDSFKEQWIAALLNKGREFWPMVTNPTVKELVQYVLGDKYHLASYLATIVNPGCPLMGLHIDQWHLPNPCPRGSAPKIRPGSMDRTVSETLSDQDPNLRINPAYTVNSIWMLTEFSDRDGATRLVPKSHRTGVNPPGDIPHPYASIAAEGPAGSVLVYDARLWHSSGAHHGSNARYALHCTFSAPQMRTMENFMASVLPEVRREMSEEMLALLGFRIWHGYGRGGDMVLSGLLDPDKPPLGRLE